MPATSPLPPNPTRVRLSLLLDTFEAALSGTTSFVRAQRPHPLLLLFTETRSTSEAPNHVLLVPVSLWQTTPELLSPFFQKAEEGTLFFILLGEEPNLSFNELLQKRVYSVLSEACLTSSLEVALVRAFEELTRKQNQTPILSQLQGERSLIDIIKSMSKEKDITSLLSEILLQARKLTQADAGSIYVLEHPKEHAQKGSFLRFKLAQNDSKQLNISEFSVPLSNTSIAGNAALSRTKINIDDVYTIPQASVFKFDTRVDQKTGYRTKSMLTLPLLSQQNEVIGVIQLLNKKTETPITLRTEQDVQDYVLSFDERDEKNLELLSTQASIFLENALLYEEIETMFLGFVNASTKAIEARDPTTSGHSKRVSLLSLTLAKTVDALPSGTYAEARFSKDDLKEIEYASLLHDFGKIGVKERVLTKANKLYEEELALIQSRFDYALLSLEHDFLKEKEKRFHETHAPVNLEELTRLETFYRTRKSEIISYLHFILEANKPTVLNEGDFSKLHAIAKCTYCTLSGAEEPLLKPHELEALCVTKGSLTPVEYEEIAGHVSHTFRFLSQIPWGKKLARVPLIAGAHHERLNGTGYPNRMRAEEIPLQSKIMSIADIFDALTASDRPYKKSVPLEKALDILARSASDGHVDSELVTIFRESRTFDVLSTSS